METELKLDAYASDLLALRAAIGDDDASGVRLVSTYYDTPADALRAAGFTLRVRATGGRFVQTVKADGAAAAGLFVRPEWEIALADARPVTDAAAGPIAAIVGDGPLEPRFVTEIVRATSELVRGDARIEVALDSGRVRAGDAEAAIVEVELELMAGPVSRLFGLARELDGVAPLRLAVESKSERGWRLAAAKEASTKAEPIRLDPDATAADAFVAIAGACLRHFRLNEARLLAGDEGPAPLHQARVALRRLRTALSLFGPLFGDDLRAGVFAAEFRAVASRLGAVRDLDVMIADRAPDVRLRDARREALDAARASLEAATTRRLMIDFVEWLTIGDWRTTSTGGSARSFAADSLSRRRKRLKRRGAGLTRLDDEARHRVRIAAKKMRYAAEFFAALWDGGKSRRRRRAFLAAIEALQDELGRLNDAATAQVTLDRLGVPVRADALDVAATLARAEEAFETLMDVKRFWR